MIAHVPSRVAGLVLLAICVVAYEQAGGGVSNRLVLPLGMALAAWLMVRNVVAVSLGTALLAGIHSDLSSADWIEARAYPAVAWAAGLVLFGTLLQRFRRRILDTREARWQGRTGRPSEPARRDGEP
jgi:hypothetical protein